MNKSKLIVNPFDDNISEDSPSFSQLSISIIISNALLLK